jgi:hypothetical protein
VLPREGDTTDKRIHIAAGLDIGLLGLAAPGPVVAPGLLVDLEREVPPGKLSFALRIEGFTGSSTLSVAPGQASLSWTFLDVQECPVYWLPAHRLTVRPCIAVTGGILEGKGSGGVTSPQDHTRPWFALGVRGRVTWTPIDRIVLEIAGGADAPLARDTFLFEPSDDIYRAPVIAVVGSASFGVQLR